MKKLLSNPIKLASRGLQNDMVTQPRQKTEATTFHRPRSDEEARRIEDAKEKERLAEEIDKLLKEITPMLSQLKRARAAEEVAAMAVQSITDNNDNNTTTKPKRSERTNKTGSRKELMQNQAAQALVDSTLQRIGNSYETIFNMNRGLIHILELIDQAPEGRISTRELLQAVNSMNMHKHLKQAETLGYIKRELERMPPGQKGGSMIVNSLTEEGHMLLALSDQYLGGRRR